MKERFWLKGGIVGFTGGLLRALLTIPRGGYDGSVLEHVLITTVFITIAGTFFGFCVGIKIRFFLRKSFPHWLRGAIIFTTLPLIYFVIAVLFSLGEGGKSGMGIFILPLYLALLFILGSIDGWLYGKIKNGKNKFYMYGLIVVMIMINIPLVLLLMSGS